MGSIVFTELKRKRNVETSKDFTYVDLTLDLSKEVKVKNYGNPETEPLDIKVSYDEFAIKNSLINIFNTIPGERFLIPAFGCNVRRYLFSPITTENAESIGDEIYDAVRLWEPRVIIDKVYVMGTPEENKYDVEVRIRIPKLKIQTNLTGILTNGGFTENRLNV